MAQPLGGGVTLWSLGPTPPLPPPAQRSWLQKDSAPKHRLLSVAVQPLIPRLRSFTLLTLVWAGKSGRARPSSLGFGASPAVTLRCWPRAGVMGRLDWAERPGWLAVGSSVDAVGGDTCAKTLRRGRLRGVGFLSWQPAAPRASVPRTRRKPHGLFCPTLGCHGTSICFILWATSESLQ